MKTVVAILMGFFSGLLINLIATMLVVDPGKSKGPSAVFAGVTFLGGWILSSVFLRRGARTLSRVFSRGFLFGAAEWLVMIGAGIVFSGKTMANTLATSGSTADAAATAGGIAALLTGGVSILMAVACLVGFAVSYLMGREMKREAMAPTKKCPQCAEMVQAEALKCRYCGTSFASGANV